MLRITDSLLCKYYRHPFLQCALYFAQCSSMSTLISTIYPHSRVLLRTLEEPRYIWQSNRKWTKFSELIYESLKSAHSWTSKGAEMRMTINNYKPRNHNPVSRYRCCVDHHPIDDQCPSPIPQELYEGRGGLFSPGYEPPRFWCGWETVPYVW